MKQPKKFSTVYLACAASEGSERGREAVQLRLSSPAFALLTKHTTAPQPSARRTAMCFGAATAPGGLQHGPEPRGALVPLQPGWELERRRKRSLLRALGTESDTGRVTREKANNFSERPLRLEAF